MSCRGHNCSCHLGNAPCSACTTCTACNPCSSCDEPHGGLRDDDCPWASSMEVLNSGHLEFGYSCDDEPDVFLLPDHEIGHTRESANDWLERLLVEDDGHWAKRKIKIHARYVTNWREVTEELAEDVGY